MPSDVLDLGNVTEEPPCIFSVLGRAAGLGVPTAMQTARSVENLCWGPEGVVGSSGGDSSGGDGLDPGVSSVWPSGFLGSPGAGETKAEVACRCFGCIRARSSHCSPVLFWGACFISRVSSILIAVVCSRGGMGGGVLGELGLFGETLRRPVWVCPPLASGHRWLWDYSCSQTWMPECLSGQVCPSNSGRVRVQSLQPPRFEGLTPTRVQFRGAHPHPPLPSFKSSHQRHLLDPGGFGFQTLPPPP